MIDRDWTEATRRRLYDHVAETLRGTEKGFDADAAELQLHHLHDRWFAAWRDPEDRRWIMVRLRWTDGGLIMDEV
jgi:hypothetical protein